MCSKIYIPVRWLDADLQTDTHYGAIRFAIEADFPELTTCDCSICRRKNALMVKVHESKFLLITGESVLTEYQFMPTAGVHKMLNTDAPKDGTPVN